MKTTEDGKSYNVVFFSSLRPSVVLTPPVLEEFKRFFKLVSTLPCDVPPGDHTAEFIMLEKYPKIKKGSVNPYIYVPGCKLEAAIEEGTFHATL